MVALRSLRLVPALLRVGLLEAVAYRGEMLVWVLATTMPLVMLALFDAVAREGPIGRYRGPELAAYFLVTFIVRQLTSSWIAWQINMDIRDGTLATRLLRPVSPLLSYATESIAAAPVRALVSLPVAIVFLVFVGAHQLSSDPVIWLLVGVSMVGAALLSLFVSATIGALALFMESSVKVMDLWLAMYFVFSGYLIPVDLFPPGLRAALDYLPFRYQIGLPVELVTGAHGRLDAVSLLARQWVFVAAVGLAMTLLWRRGLSRFSAYGG